MTSLSYVKMHIDFNWNPPINNVFDFHWFGYK